MKKNYLHCRQVLTLFALSLIVCVGLIKPASIYADEGGTSFWLPGQFSSLAAVQAEPGWSIASIYYHASLSGDGSNEFPSDSRVTLGLDVQEDLLLAVPAYVFDSPLWGGQAAISIAGLYGRADVSVDATLSDSGGVIVSGSESDSLTAAGDLYPQFNLRWNHGVHNTMAYTMLGIPVGSYKEGRLANIGTNHWSVDLGGGYTYLNQENGREFSAVAGLTYNFENPDTNYQSGMDLHLDWGLSQFISEQVHIGFVGYFFHQITGDSGSGALLGDFKSSVDGIGPQIGYLFNIGDKSAYFNLKAYWDYSSKHRPDGWNSWVTFSLPL